MAAAINDPETSVVTYSKTQSGMERDFRSFIISAERYRNGAPGRSSNLVRRLPRRRHLRLVLLLYVIRRHKEAGLDWLDSPALQDQ